MFRFGWPPNVESSACSGQTSAGHQSKELEHARLLVQNLAVSQNKVFVDTWRGKYGSAPGIFVMGGWNTACEIIEAPKAGKSTRKRG